VVRECRAAHLAGEPQLLVIDMKVGDVETDLDAELARLEASLSRQA
jgi:hypothetical protein